MMWVVYLQKHQGGVLWGGAISEAFNKIWETEKEI